MSEREKERVMRDAFLFYHETNYYDFISSEAFLCILFLLYRVERERKKETNRESVRVYICICVCVCVCVRERERERERITRDEFLHDKKKPL